MNTYSCIIVDDEPVSRDILRKYIRDIPGLEILCECKDAFEASREIPDKQPDILFLDINMPRLSGISFARSLSKPPLLIFTTAYPEFAVEGFDLDAVDYLVKPFSFERFLKAVNRATERLQEGKDSNVPDNNLLVRSDKKIYSIRQSDISVIEGCGDYIKICLSDDRKLIVHDTLKGFYKLLSEHQFMRVHRSYVINLVLVEHIDGNIARLGQYEVPVSSTYRNILLEKLEKK